MISYYELLGMIKEGKAPNKIKVHLTPVSSRNYISEYDIDESFSYYRLEELEEDENDDYRFCLAECYLESSMFDETIEILDEKKIPEKLDIQIQNEKTGNTYITNEKGTKCYLTKHSKIIAERLNQVIDYLKSKGE